MKRLAIILVAGAVPLVLAACGGNEATTEPAATQPEATDGAVSERCDRPSTHTTRRSRRTRPPGPVLDEEPFQRRLLRACTRAEWLAAAEGYRDTVVLAEPVDVLDAMCGSPRSKALACKEER